MNIYVWGTSPLAGRIVGHVILLEEVKGFIDNYFTGQEFMDKPVIRPDSVLNSSYDAIVVASTYADEIYRQSKAIGLDTGRMVFPFANIRTEDLNKDYGFVEAVLGTEYADMVKHRNHIVQDCEAGGYMCLSGSRLKQDRSYKNDFVRHRVFELCAKEVKKRSLKGAVAELGVYKGQFAQYISAAFPDRKLFLFDTFEGFDEKLAQEEVMCGNVTDTWVEAFKNTNIVEVIRRMTNKENVIVKRGLFPETVDEELQKECFMFVSIDVDLEQSIYDGLSFFYPRLERGGYIFIHDYNGPLPGVEHAVDRYELENGIELCRVPVCDTDGTLIITK